MLDRLIHKVIINPASGGGSGLRIGKILPRLFAEHGLRGEFHFSKTAHHFQELVRRCSEGEDHRLVVCGGDGSVNMVLSALREGIKVRMGLIPSGRGNDLARSLGVPHATKQAVSLLAAGREQLIDLGYVGHRPFATIAASGYDALVSIAASKITVVKGKLVYLVAALKELARYKAQSFRVRGDDFFFEGPAMMVSLANAPYYGGGMQLSPGSSLTDGYLDVCIVPKIKKSAFLRILPHVFKGEHVQSPHFLTAAVRSVEVSSLDGSPVCADGEVLGKTPIVIGVKRAVLSVVCGHEFS